MVSGKSTLYRQLIGDLGFAGIGAQLLPVHMRKVGLSKTTRKIAQVEMSIRLRIFSGVGID